jgi:hypothetical protein
VAAAAVRRRRGRRHGRVLDGEATTVASDLERVGRRRRSWGEAGGDVEEAERAARRRAVVRQLRKLGDGDGRASEKRRGYFLRVVR